MPYTTCFPQYLLQLRASILLQVSRLGILSAVLIFIGVSLAICAHCCAPLHSSLLQAGTDRRVPQYFPSLDAVVSGRLPLSGAKSTVLRSLTTNHRQLVGGT